MKIAAVLSHRRINLTLFFTETTWLVLIKNEINTFFLKTHVEEVIILIWAAGRKVAPLTDADNVIFLRSMLLIIWHLPSYSPCMRIHGRT